MTAAPFRPRTRDELACLEQALDAVASAVVAEIESIADGIVNPFEVLAATTELSTLVALFNDLRDHAAASRKKTPKEDAPKKAKAGPAKKAKPDAKQAA